MERHRVVFPDHLASAASPFDSMAVLKYGSNASVRLELAAGCLPVQCGIPRGAPPADLAVAVVDALEEPLDFPPLARSTTPGDRVVLALDHAVPQVAQITEAVIRCLVNAGVDPDGVTVLQTQADVDKGIEDPCRLVPSHMKERIAVSVHHPRDRKGLAYLAANQAGEPILVSRAIHDADLVLPIGCLRPETAAGYYGVHGVIFPSFSDERTLSRFRCLGSPGAGGNHKRALIEEVDQVAWLLGINFTVQLVPAAGTEVLHVIAGQSDAVRRRGRQLYQAAWRCPVAQRASLVVAAIEGNADQQTWQSLGCALEAAVDLVEEGGAIAVCCDLAAQPGPAVQQMLGAASREAVMRRIRKERPSDALTAGQLARALDHARVYLLSRLDPDTVEDLEMIYLAAPDELARLARQHTSGILLSNAPRAAVLRADVMTSRDE